MRLNYNILNVETYRVARMREFKQQFPLFWKQGQSEGRYLKDEIFDHNLEEGIKNSFHMTINTLLDCCNDFDESDVPYLKEYLEVVEQITDRLEEVVQQTGLTKEQIYENKDYRKQAYTEVLTTKEKAIAFEKARHELFMRPKRRELDKRFPIKRALAKEVSDLFIIFWDAALDFYLERVEQVYL